MVESKNCCIQLADAEIRDLKSATKKETVKDALQEAVEFIIEHKKAKQ